MRPDHRISRKRHPIRTQVLAMLIALALVWIVTGVMLLRGGPGKPMPQRFLYQLRRLEIANAEAEAAIALDQGDHRLLVLERGDGQRIPGVSAPDARAHYGVKVLPYLFDATTNKDQEQLQHAAFEYAFKYNLFVLKKLAGSPATQPQTIPTTRPTTIALPKS